MLKFLGKTIIFLGLIWIVLISINVLGRMEWPSYKEEARDLFAGMRFWQAEDKEDYFTLEQEEEIPASAISLENLNYHKEDLDNVEIVFEQDANSERVEESAVDNPGLLGIEAQIRDIRMQTEILEEQVGQLEILTDIQKQINTISKELENLEKTMKDLA